MSDTSVVLDFFIKNYFDNNLKLVSEMTGYKENQIELWRSGERKPRKATLEYIIYRATNPEFQIINEFFSFTHIHPIQKQLKEMLGQHTESTGIYSFYDSMENLIYLGKATNLLKEITSALNREIHIFPKNLVSKPQKRNEVIKYISAYFVGENKFDDYPKHVESLFLKISKPVLNKNLGNLYHVTNPDE